MAVIIPVGSGKGGVGKTVFCAGLGTMLAMAGKTVILVDLDLGGANLHTYLGIRNKNPGLGSIIWKKEKKLESLIIPTNTDHLYLIPGDNLLPGTANLEYFTKVRIIKELNELIADYVLLDLGAGASYNVIDFWLMSKNSLIVTSPEIPSILNAYSFLKTAIYRYLFRSFKKGSEERKRISEFAAIRKEGQSETFIDFTKQLCSEESPIYKSLLEMSPKVVVNMGAGQDDAIIAKRLQTITMRNLGIKAEFIAYIMRDLSVKLGLDGSAVFTSDSNGTLFQKGLKAATERILHSGSKNLVELNLDDEIDYYNNHPFFDNKAY